MADKKTKKDEESAVKQGEEAPVKQGEEAPEVPEVPVVPVETPQVEEKDLSRTNMDQAEESGIQTYGDPGAWKTVCKAWNEKEGWMKCTKAMQVGAAGCLIQVTTQQRNKDGSWAIAEAVCLAHGVNLVEEGGRARFLT